MSLSTEEQLLKLVPLVRWLIVGAVGMGAWVATIELRAAIVPEHEHRLNQMDVWRAETLANRYTSAEANRLQTTLAEALANHDKRISRNEDTLAMIKDVLVRLERKIQP